MNRDRWTLLLLKGEESPIRQFAVSPRGVNYAVGGILLVMLTLSGLTVAMGWDGAAHLRAARLRAENEALTEELERIRARVGELEGTVEGLSEKDARIRMLAGLDSIDQDVLQVGVGGPGLETPEEHALWPVDSSVAKTAFAVDYDLAALERRATLLAESMEEATDSLMAHRDLLESTPSILPTPGGLLSSRFARRRYHPIHHRPLPHEGIDISAPKGTPILAAAKGTVARSGWVVGYGQVVEIDHGFGFTTLYGHCSKLLVRAGQQVERGDVVAQVGSSGIATSSHLHYEVRVNGRPQNPLNYVLPEKVF